METDKKSKYIKLAGFIALFGNLILAATKISLGIYSSSLAVIGDGIDSSTDVLIALITILISKIISKPSDKTHPWGHERAETVATMILSFIIFTAGAELCISSAKKIFTKSFSQELSFWALTAVIISILGKILLYISQVLIGKKSKSQIIKANAQNMKNDIIMSCGILLGLSLSLIFKLPILDPIIAFLVGIWVIKNAIKIFIEQNTELMDGNKDLELYNKLFKAVSTVPKVSNPHGARIRKIASHFDIDLDIEVDPFISIFEAHELSEQVEEAIRKEIPESLTVMIHIEPKNSSFHQRTEEFGVKPE